jgi:hypothetical protein
MGLVILITRHPHSMEHSITPEACNDPLIGVVIDLEAGYLLEYQTYILFSSLDLTQPSHYWVIRRNRTTESTSFS